MPLEDILPVAGAVIGGIYGGPAGAAVGSSAGKMFSSAIKGKRADKNLPEPIDPLQMGFLNEINELRKSFKTGSGYANQMNELKNIQASTQSGILKAAGGNTGAAISGMARVGRNTQAAFGDIAEAGVQNQMKLLELAGEKTDQIVQRKAELDLMQFGQGKKDSAEQHKAGSNEMNKVVASGVLDDIFKKDKG